MILFHRIIANKIKNKLIKNNSIRIRINFKSKLMVIIKLKIIKKKKKIYKLVINKKIVFKKMITKMITKMIINIVNK